MATSFSNIGCGMNRSENDLQLAKCFQFGQMKRKHRRAEVSGFVGNFVSGNLVCAGDVQDISLGGFRIKDIPQSFGTEKHAYTIVLSGRGKHFRVLAKPCWKKEGSEKSNVDIGFKILDAPWEWVEFTTKEIPEFDYEDTFGYQA